MTNHKRLLVQIIISLILLTGCFTIDDDILTTQIPYPEGETTQPSQEIIEPFLEETTAPSDNYIRSKDGMQMLFVPAGSFQMGSDEKDPESTHPEYPQHLVTLDQYWIDETEVTNAQYNLCVDTGECINSRYADNATYNADNYPIVGISWQEAADYCEWAGGRLPTEAEWEYAAKGPDEFLYPWGNLFDGNNLNYCDSNCTESWTDPNIDDGYPENAPVGNFPMGASWVGALDMAGNVWEWTWDWCGNYSSNPQINPTGPPNGSCKIIRGGAWASPPNGARTTFRIIEGDITPDTRHPNIGFRCVISADSHISQEKNMAPIPIPIGISPTIDGKISPNEWEDAKVETFSDGSELFLKQSNGFLYLGIKAVEDVMIVGNVYIQQDDQIKILHTSAALGTAIYEFGENWQKIQDFSWRCRHTGNSEAAQNERVEFFQNEGWLAANGRMGTPNELEYQITIPNIEFRLAVVYTRGVAPHEKVSWPANLVDATIQPTPGGFPLIMEFSPNQWGVINIE